ncbi:hypothetical protein [Terrabacter terrigena]|uniref:Lipoprotein n=1 Tax=Terrabacter terrigena TaxID=574718 RepID=A0ABW3N5C1_9MICO
MKRIRSIAAVVVCGYWALAGCSTGDSPGPAGAGQAAEAFAAAVTGQPDAACALVAPGTVKELVDSSGSCAKGITDADLPRAGRALDVEVFGLDAIVRLEHDTMFLAFFDSGWRVTAAGCTPEARERPYSCDLKGA